MNERNSPEYWQSRAEEARAVAEQMHNAECRKTMREIAVGYELMAETALRLRKYDRFGAEGLRSADKGASSVKSTRS